MDVQQHSRLAPFVTKEGSTIRELLSHRNSAIRRQSLAEARVLPGIRTQPHRHPLNEEISCILAGEARIFLEDELSAVGLGDAFAIPSGHVHSIEKIGSAELIFPGCCVPASEHEDPILLD